MHSQWCNPVGSAVGRHPSQRAGGRVSDHQWPVGGIDDGKHRRQLVPQSGRSRAMITTNNPTMFAGMAGFNPSPVPSARRTRTSRRRHPSLENECSKQARARSCEPRPAICIENPVPRAFVHGFRDGGRCMSNPTECHEPQARTKAERRIYPSQWARYRLLRGVELVE